MENMKRDLGDVLKLDAYGPRIVGIRSARIRYLKLKLYVRLDFVSGELLQSLQYAEITCTNAVDYAIRPPDPNILMGGPLIELHEQHPRLEHRDLQDVPGGDGEEFEPPLKFKLLILDQTYVIAEEFEIQPWQPTASNGAL